MAPGIIVSFCRRSVSRREFVVTTASAWINLASPEWQTPLVDYSCPSEEADPVMAKQLGRKDPGGSIISRLGADGLPLHVVGLAVAVIL